jgi:hypothetical protein
MIDEILPLPPKNSSATARKMSQCQTLKPPISPPLLVQPLLQSRAFSALSQKGPVPASLPRVV